MRVIFIAAVIAGLGACAKPEAVHIARMPLEILRAEGEAPRMGEVYLEAGSFDPGSRFAFQIWIDPEGDEIGTLRGVTWAVKFPDYCRDQATWVQSVLIGPSGQVWRGYRTYVPAGPDRHQDWSSGGSGAERHGGPATPGLLEAAAEGGRFTIGLEDNTGQRIYEEVIDTLTPARREQLFAANVEAVRNADPAMPVAGERLYSVVSPALPALPNPPRPCP